MPNGSEEHYLEIYNRHNDEVKQFFAGYPHFPLLRVEDGLSYEPLCRFLDRPVVAEPFPYLYKTST